MSASFLEMGNMKHIIFSHYMEILVDELISLSNATLFDAYQQANFSLKVEILFYVLDYPGIAKLFNIRCAGSYHGCAWCDIKGTT